MAEFETPETDNLIDNERFQQKRQEAETGMRPSPFEIRGEPIDFAAAKAALEAKKQKSEQKSEPTEIPVTVSNETDFAKLNDERVKLMTELEGNFRKIEAGLEIKRDGDLEKIRQTNPDLADVLETQMNLGLMKEFRSMMKTSIYRAATKDELEQIAAKSREFLASVTKVS